MSISGVLPASSDRIPSSPLVSQATEQQTRIKESSKEIFRTLEKRLEHCKAKKLLEKIPHVFRKIVPVCIDLASTAFIPVQESLSDPFPGINLGIALVQNVICLWSIGRKVHSSVHAVEEKRSCLHKLKEAERKLSCATSPVARANLEIEIKNLNKTIHQCNTKLFSLRHLPEMAANLAWYGLTGLEIVCKKISVVGEAALAGIRTAGTIAGAAAGGLAILLGGIESALGIRSLILARNKKKEVDANVERFREAHTSNTGVPEEVWGSLRKIRCLELMRDQLKADKNFKLGILRVSGGSLATVAGALGIAATFTAGVAAAGIAVAALVVGMIGLGVTIGTYLKRRKLKEEMATLKVTNKQFEEVLTYLNSPECSIEQKAEIAQVLDIDVHKLEVPEVRLKHKYRKILCTEADIHDLASYLCTGRASVNQQLKFAQIFNKPVSVIFDRQEFLEKIIAKAFLKKGLRISKRDVSQLSTYFLSKRSTEEAKTNVAKILNVNIDILNHRLRVLQEFLIDFLMKESYRDNVYGHRWATP